MPLKSEACARLRSKSCYGATDFAREVSEVWLAI
jgi:hypothetical protein